MKTLKNRLNSMLKNNLKNNNPKNQLDLVVVIIKLLIRIKMLPELQVPQEFKVVKTIKKVIKRPL